MAWLNREVFNIGNGMGKIDSGGKEGEEIQTLAAPTCRDSSQSQIVQRYLVRLYWLSEWPPVSRITGNHGTLDNTGNTETITNGIYY